MIHARFRLLLFRRGTSRCCYTGSVEGQSRTRLQRPNRLRLIFAICERAGTREFSEVMQIGISLLFVLGVIHWNIRAGFALVLLYRAYMRVSLYGHQPLGLVVRTGHLS